MILQLILLLLIAYIILVIVFQILVKNKDLFSESKRNINYVEHFRKNVSEQAFGGELGKEGFANTVKVIAYDGKDYNVSEKYMDKKEASNVLAKINQKNLELIAYLKKKYPDDKRTKLLSERYNPGNIFEVDPFNAGGDTSYTVNKGKELGICVRQKTSSAEFVNFNHVYHVVIHELAHIASKSNGHNDEHYDSFVFLLKAADESGIYKEIINYHMNPQPYCGIQIIDDPLI